MNTNIFEAATRQRLRFPSPSGNLSVEDLWDLTLEGLDAIAITLNKKVKESSEESFIKKQRKGDKKAELQLAVVVSIIETKVADAEKAKNAADRKAKREKLMELISSKQDDALSRKSITQLKAELDKLDDEEE